jgi:hypothetical protein
VAEPRHYDPKLLHPFHQGEQPHEPKHAQGPQRPLPATRTQAQAVPKKNIFSIFHTR